MKKVIALLENTETRNLLQENQVLVETATNELGYWYNYLAQYVTENIEEFLDASLEETAKNIYTFSSFATKQMITELSSCFGKQLHSAQVLKEAARTEFM